MRHIKRFTIWLLDRFDHLILQHRFHSLCNWICLHGWWGVSPDEKQFIAYLKSIGAFREDGTVDYSKLKHKPAQTFEELEVLLSEDEMNSPFDVLRRFRFVLASPDDPQIDNMPLLVCQMPRVIKGDGTLRQEAHQIVITVGEMKAMLRTMPNMWGEDNT